MSGTDYTYDEQVRLHMRTSEHAASNQSAGPVLSLLHPHGHHTRHRPHYNFLFKAE